MFYYRKPVARPANPVRFQIGDQFPRQRKREIEREKRRREEKEEKEGRKEKDKAEPSHRGEEQKNPKTRKNTYFV